MTETTDRTGSQTVFHEKRTYRRRRLMDAARLAPLLALFLWLVPLFWPQSGDDGIGSATALIYIFGVWGSVILLTFGLSRALGRSLDRDVDAEK